MMIAKIGNYSKTPVVRNKVKSHITKGMALLLAKSSPAKMSVKGTLHLFMLMPTGIKCSIQKAKGGCLLQRLFQMLTELSMISIKAKSLSSTKSFMNVERLH